MPTLINKTQRLINTHDMVAIPPGVPTEVSDEAMAHADIQQALTDGHLVNPESPIDATRKEGEQEEKPDQPSPTFNTGPQPQDKSGRTEPNPPARAGQQAQPTQQAQPNQSNQPNQQANTQRPQQR